jgi:hypothetical protein
MLRILRRYATAGKPVPTPFEGNLADPDLATEGVEVTCPYCNTMHLFDKREAYLDGEPPGLPQHGER